MKSKKSKKPQKAGGQYVYDKDLTKKQWWRDKRLEQSETPSFQRYQFEDLDADPHALRRVHKEPPLSARALSELYGDNSLERHIERLLDGLHELVSS